MKKQKMLAVLLAGAMIFSVFGCGEKATVENSEKETGSDVQSSETVNDGEEDKTGIVFPLEEEVTYDVVVRVADGGVKIEDCQLWQDLYEATNVKINLIELEYNDAMTQLNAMLTAGDDIDAIFSCFVGDADMSSMAANGLLQPIGEYITEDIMPNFTGRVVSENPNVMGVITMPDGNIYTMPYYNALMGDYLESTFWINKTWVEKAGWSVDDIKTIDDLETVLTYFRDNDMNGNGDAEDEIPYIMLNGHSANHVEAFLGLYGIATKDSSFESYVTIKDGEVIFAPMTDAWKDAIIKLSDWNDKGILWSQVFLDDGATWMSYLEEGASPVVGLYNGKTPPLVNSEEYVQLLPVSVEGYETEYYIHPGSMGGKGMFCVTNSCENPEILMAWLDQLYSFENSVRANYGELEDGRWGYNDNGLIEFYTLDADTMNEKNETAPTLKVYLGNSIPPSAITAADYENSIALAGDVATKMESYHMYKSYFTDETWPRPYFDAESSARMSELRTDIFGTLQLKKAEWITGVADIEAEYDSFVEELKTMGIDEFIEIMQNTYDVYSAATK